MVFLGIYKSSCCRPSPPLHDLVLEDSKKSKALYMLFALSSAKMRCPFCSSIETKVVDKRDASDSDATRRRRECLKCMRRFTTYERMETTDLFVVKKDGRRESFESEKLKKGLLRACEKRPVSMDKIGQIVASIEAELKSKNKKEINSAEIGNLVMRKLKSTDKVAYIRFASVYRDFNDIMEFKEELSKFEKKRK